METTATTPAAKPTHTVNLAPRFSAAALAAAEEATKSEAPRGGVTYHDLFPDGVDLDQFRRLSGDTAARAVISDALAEFEHLDAVRLRAKDIRHAEAALKELAAAGITLTPEDESAAFFQLRNEEAQARALASLDLQNKARLSAACEDEIRRCTAKIVNELSAELQRVAAFDSELRAKWPTMAVPNSRLRQSLGAAVLKLGKELQAPFDVSWHHTPRIALSYYFAAPL